MRNKAATGFLLILLLIGVLPLVFNVQPVGASGTIYIRADGSIDPPTANITTVDNVTYTFTDNNYDSIVVERGNIIVDGNGYTLQGTGHSNGFYWSGIDNVTIKNTTITNFHSGIDVYSSSFNTISGNNITDMGIDGVYLWYSNNNTVSGNNITDIRFTGIWLFYSNNSIISGNNITIIELGECIYLYYSSNNNISGNYMAVIRTIGAAVRGYESSGNRFYHNFMSRIYVFNDGSVNVWDDGYPSGGNYWSDYAGVDLYGGPYQNETGSDGIGDAQYVIDANNTDFYPLMSPYPSVHAISVEVERLKTSIGQGLIAKLYVHVANGHFTENVNATAYANSTVVDALTNITLTSGNSTITFTWDTTGFAKGSYNISFYVTPVPNELYTKDNTYTYWVLVTIAGDVDGNQIVDVIDQRIVQLAMFTVPGHLDWDANSDVDSNLRVDVIDQRLQQLHMFESW